jgi:hypothetical protein
VENAGIGARLAALPLQELRVPPRVKTIRTLRQRLQLTVLPEVARPVIIRHTGQNLGSLPVAVSETRPVQNPPA